MVSRKKIEILFQNKDRSNTKENENGTTDSSRQGDHSDLYKKSRNHEGESREGGLYSGSL